MNMFKNHLVFAVRLFLKDKFYSLLNILGLALGICCGVLVLLYLQHDLTYDLHHKNHRNIYRLTNHLQATGADFNTARTALELGPLLLEEYPEIQSFVRFEDFYNPALTYKRDGMEPIQIYVDKAFRTDSSIFSVFTHEFIKGDPHTALTGLDKMVITEKIEKQLFGDEDGIGKLIEFDDRNTYEVTGVIKELPQNTHLNYDVLLSGLPLIREWVEGGDEIRWSEGFWNPDSYTYLVFNKGYNPKDFDQNFPRIFEKYFSGFAAQINGKATFELQALSDIHFQSKKGRDEPQGNINYTYTFASIGLFIILLACINYVNIATARATNRASEMGVRKVLGFDKRKLFASILTEALVLTVLALLLAILLCVCIIYLTPFNDWINKDLQLDFLENTILLPGAILLTILITLLSGIYPALYLPSIPVVSALKGAFKSNTSGILLRKALIVVQFVISIFVIVCTSIMGDQIDFLRNKELGFNKDNIVLLAIQDTLVRNQLPVIKQTFLQNPKITAATLAYGVPGLYTGGSVFRVETHQGDMTQQEFNTIFVGEDYLNTMEIQLISGRDFYKDSQADKELRVLVNEAATKMMGWEDDALGKKIKFYHGETEGEVIGVVKDFNFNSLHNKIEPLVIGLADTPGGHLHLRVKSEDLQETMSFIESQWKQFDPNHAYEFSFLDADFNEQYQADETQHRLIRMLSYICIFISLLGLIGLASFTAGQKTKEIGVRKALGGSSFNIIGLFSKGYMKLIVIALIIAIPIANYIISEWLQGFAYQVDLNWYNFAIPGTIVMAVALLTVILQTMKAAAANPVDALRNE
ncbi:FtsX-like permease family protein [Fulvivirga sp. M361]|uniref:ABC transporter permease n=1 Tax=Fulvivirga sp. M361 TaxID=2594266 RepID=UPI00117B5457|nr:ABC transporter permease [Fulvivirga sp. M361]TRX56265.1 FtsX-like permease family protein [Fulvivirga sp. M361]